MLVSVDADQLYRWPPLSKAVLAGEEPTAVTSLLEDDSVLDRIDRPTPVLRPPGRGHRLRAGTLPGAHQDAAIHGLRTLEHGRRLDDAVQAARSVVVVGSGFIGCEAAASLARRWDPHHVGHPRERAQGDSAR